MAFLASRRRGGKRGGGRGWKPSPFIFSPPEGRKGAARRVPRTADTRLLIKKKGKASELPFPSCISITLKGRGEEEKRLRV